MFRKVWYVRVGLLECERSEQTNAKEQTGKRVETVYRNTVAGVRIWAVWPKGTPFGSICACPTNRFWQAGGTYERRGASCNMLKGIYFFPEKKYAFLLEFD